MQISSQCLLSSETLQHSGRKLPLQLPPHRLFCTADKPWSLPLQRGHFHGMLPLPCWIQLLFNLAKDTSALAFGESLQGRKMGSKHLFLIICCPGGDRAGKNTGTGAAFSMVWHGIVPGDGAPAWDRVFLPNWPLFLISTRGFVGCVWC